MKLLQKIMKIDWVPLQVPLHRRLELLATASWMITILFGELVCLLLYLALLYKGNLAIKTLCIVYGIFMYFDRETGLKGGRGEGSKWVRNWIWWKYFQQYFPAKLHKTVDLPADRNYLFATFPHGIVSYATFINFATSATNTRQQLPGIRTKVTSLDYHFKIPFFREFLFSWGMGSVSATGLVNILSQSNSKDDPSNQDGFTSNAAIVMIGGAQESLYCRPNKYQFVIKKRKGFIRVAFKTGASIVPVISFGEVDLYDAPANPPGSKLRRYQEWLKELTGIAPAKFIGRGFFQYNYGLYPRRRPLNTVVGAPMDLPKNENPSKKDIDKVHAEFCTSLNILFESHKSKYVQDFENVELIME